jgi:hypothetical protein
MKHNSIKGLTINRWKNDGDKTKVPWKKDWTKEAQDKRAIHYHKETKDIQ